MVQTRQQQMARIIYEHVDSVKNETWAEEYGRLCLNFPALLHINGLCQVVAFYEAKGSKENSKPYYKRFLNHLAETVNIANWAKIREMNAIEYQRLTRKVFEAASWYKRYAEAILKVDQGDEPTGEQSGDSE